MAQDFRSFGSALLVDFVIFLVALIVFDVLRRLAFAKKFITPKRYMTNEEYAQPRPLPGGRCFQWVIPLFSYTDQEIVRTAGYDAGMFLTLLSFGLKLFGILSLWNLVSVLPVNIAGDQVDLLMRYQSGDLSQAEKKELEKTDGAALNTTTVDTTEPGEEPQKYDFTNFDKVSMSNIKPGSPLLWVHVLAVYFATIVTLKLLAQYHHRAVKKRIEYLSTTDRGAESHTVLVSDIPGVKFGTMLARLMGSPLFKYLPKKMQLKIEETIDTMFGFASSVISQGLSRGGSEGKSTPSLGNLLQSYRTKPDAIKDVKKQPGIEPTGDEQQFVDSLENSASEDPRSSHPRAKEVTDMDPTQWVKQRLVDETTVEDIVYLQFKEVFPNNSIVSANVVQDTTALEKVFKNYEAAKLKLDNLVDEYTNNLKGNKKVKRKKTKVISQIVGKWAEEEYGKKPVTVDLLDFLVKNLKALEVEIKKLQEDAENMSTATAFVTFKSRFSQVVSATSLHHHFETFWQTVAAPHPDDIVWENLSYRAWERTARTVSIWTSFALLCIFFMIPIGIVQAMIEIDRLEKYAVIGPIVKVSFIRGILVGILPNLVLKIFLAILPSLLHFMNKVQGLYALSTIDLETTRKYFIFQVITVFFFSFMIGSSLGQLDQLREDFKTPSRFIDVLGTSAPQTASFFINYILVSGLVEGAISFLRVPGLVIFWLLSKLSGSPKARTRLWQDQKILYGEHIPHITLVVLLGLVFSAVNPLVLPATFLYFLVMTIYWRFSMLYVYRQSYQSGGKIWVELFNQILTGLMIMQLLMIGLMAVKKFRYALFITPLPFVTIAFKIIMDKNYRRPLSVLSLRAAHDLDVMDAALDEQLHAQDGIQDGAQEDRKDKNKGYVHPALKVDWNELHELLDEAATASEMLSQAELSRADNAQAGKEQV